MKHIFIWMWVSLSLCLLLQAPESHAQSNFAANNDRYISYPNYKPQSNHRLQAYHRTHPYDTHASYSPQSRNMTYSNSHNPQVSQPSYPRTPFQHVPLLQPERETTLKQQNTKKESVAETVQYKVQAGDTLYRIANAFNTSVEMLMVENHINDPSMLQIGATLTVPSADQSITTWLDESKEIKQVLSATLTAYTAGYESTGKTPSHPEYGITASGAKVKANHTIAVDPKLIPLGTLVYIEGLGIRKAEDIGSAIKGTKIDVYIPDLEEARQFGVKKNVKVYVLETDNKDRSVQIASAQ